MSSVASGSPPSGRRAEAPRPEDVAAAGDAGSVAVRGPVPALAAVLARAAQGRPQRAGAGAVGAGRRQGLPRPRPRPRRRQRRAARARLVRDDHGGVLLHHGRDRGRRRRTAVAEPPARSAGPPRRHQGGRRRDHPDRRPAGLAGGRHHRRDRDDAAAAPDPADQRPGPAGGLRPGADRPRRRRLTRARSAAGPGTPTSGCAGCSSPEGGPCSSPGDVVDTGAAPARRGGPTADVPRPDRCGRAGDQRSPARLRRRRRPRLPRGRRTVGRALARPSLPALVGLVVVVVFFARAGARAAHLRRAGQRPRHRPRCWASAGWRSPCCSSPASSTSRSASSPSPARC